MYTHTGSGIMHMYSIFKNEKVNTEDLTSYKYVRDLLSSKAINHRKLSFS